MRYKVIESGQVVLKGSNRVQLEGNEYFVGHLTNNLMRTSNSVHVDNI